MNDTEIRTILARNIKSFRRRRNWSQAYLAEKSCLSIVFISDIERGNKWPYIRSLIRLADALEVEFYELFKPQESTNPEDRLVISRYSAEARAIVVKQLESAEETIISAMMNLQNTVTR